MRESTNLPTPPVGTDPAEDEPLSYKVTKAARLLDVSERVVWELVRTGVIESFKIGASRRIPRSALLAYIESLRGAA